MCQHICNSQMEMCRHVSRELYCLQRERIVGCKSAQKRQSLKFSPELHI